MSFKKLLGAFVDIDEAPKQEQKLDPTKPIKAQVMGNQSPPTTQQTFVSPVSSTTAGNGFDEVAMSLSMSFCSLKLTFG